MNTTPTGDRFVSVVIPTFNHATFLPDAIDSALGQDYRNFEIVIVDDGSTDGSRAVAAGYLDRVRYIWQENAGLSAARNAGINAARGGHIAFLDADDTWSPTFLSTVMARWQADPELGAVYTGFSTMDRAGRALPQNGTAAVPEDALHDRLLDGEFFVPSAVVVKRDCFDNVGLFDETLRGSEDWDMWMRVARKYRFAGIPTPLVNYRVHGSNMSGNPEYMLRYQLMVVEKHFGPPGGPPESWPREQQRALAAVYRYAVQGYYLRGDAATAGQYLRCALEANPDLCNNVDMYYELGCADRPLGQRSIRAPIDVEKNGRFVLATLHEIFDQPNLSTRLRGRRRPAIGHACLAMGLLSYGIGRVDLARRYLINGLATNPRLLSDWRAVNTLARSVLGLRVIRALRTMASAGRQVHAR
jgi:hypothetical protein